MAANLFNRGDLVYLKTSNERVQILDSKGTDPTNGVYLYVISVPRATKEHGIIHVQETRFEFELDTLEGMIRRTQADMDAEMTLRRAEAKPAVSELFEGATFQ